MRHRPDVLVLDIALGGMSSLPALADVRAASPATNTLVLTMHEDPAFVRAAFAGGALGYLLKDAAAGELVAAVHRVAAGQGYLHRALDTHRATDPAMVLTDREASVLSLLAAGHTNAEIGRQLYLSLRTVETVRASVREKLGADRRVDLVAAARRTGVLR